MPRERFDLDGRWDFVPGDVDLAAARAGRGREHIAVPGLWEAQGRLELDGVAWCLRDVEVPDPVGHWTLGFGAVMDEADVYVNGRPVGRHDGGYTPFALDVGAALRSGTNEIAVRVEDHVAGTPGHLRSPHGKQGWKPEVFPSPPSLYLTYGGIWQSVRLDRHGPVTVEDVFVSSDPADLTVLVEVRNHTTGHLDVQVDAAPGGASAVVGVPAGETARCRLPLDAAGLRWWTPEDPALHHAVVRCRAGSGPGDERTVRFGLRTVDVEGDRLRLNGRPLAMRAALVQGYRADTLYAEGTRDQIEREVRAARAAGLNTLRLHIKAFHPDYLDVCDELGMLLHCDLPVAEPLAIGELDSTGPLAERCLGAAREQVRRDRNHPSIVLWSAMNEIGAEDVTVRTLEDAGYQRFAVALYETVMDLDGTRPVIENDWLEPVPSYFTRSPVLTAHWYGRLSSAYLTGLRARTLAAAGGRALLVSEFGDWALPEPDDLAEQPFWAAGELVHGPAAAGWPAGAADFARGTRRYKGLSDRLQIEVFRSTGTVAGWCLTELTDVPQEYNGLWQLDRRPKAEVVEEIRRACSPVLPILLPAAGPAAGYDAAWTAWADGTWTALLVVSHDGDAPSSGTARVWLTDPAGRDLGAGDTVEVKLRPYGVGEPVPVTVATPAAAGTYQVRVTLDDGRRRWHNRYPLHVHPRPGPPAVPVTYAGDEAGREALTAAGALVGACGPLVIGEEAMTADLRRLARSRLAAGTDVLLLRQPAAAATALPVPAVLCDLRTEWGSTPYVFSTDGDALPSLPARTVLTTELATVSPDVVYTSLGASAVTLAVWKPPPAPVRGQVVASVRVARARLVVCQLPLAAPALRGDPTATAILADLLGGLSGGVGGGGDT